MTDAVHEYHSGDQQIEEQVATFSAFGRMIKWGSLVLASGLLALVLWFCVNAGFLAGACAAVVLLALGIYFLRSKPEAAH
ncbi:MAG TPA: aa3-type cytochrome c oxidase subunit IV [Caulobacteraceae bacterium]|jgi:hypothetical protein|nr:aa3-type cytochrome c oxidase subunit IV [Caulobacteraceae bacterium]